MKTEDYQKYANGNASDKIKVKNYPASQLAGEGRPGPRLIPARVTAAMTPAMRRRPSPYVHRLSGQDSAYLKRALQEYHNNLRQSGFMEPIAVELDDERINSLADYYASLEIPVNQPVQSPPSAGLEMGRQLAEQGDLARKIPACLSCHGENKRSGYPHLAGQPEQYLRQQLKVLQRGVRAKTSHGAIRPPLQSA